MGALGVLELIRSDESFTSEQALPRLPGAQHTGVGSAAKRANRAPDGDAIATVIAANLATTLRSARSMSDDSRTSTSLAARAQALEMSGDEGSAVTMAEEALEICATANGQLVDPAAVRLALGVLFRCGASESGLAHARALPISEHLSLVVGALLAERGRFEEAHEFIDDICVPEQDAVLGFLLLKEGKPQPAVAKLRKALRRVPDDADSAFNLSIALWNLRSYRKAIAAAHQAALSAPGRMDVALHFFRLLLAENDFVRVDREIRSLLEKGVEAPPQLLIVHARALLAMQEKDSAIKMLERARDLARTEGDETTLVEVESNLLRIRARRNDRDDAFVKLLTMHRNHPDATVVVANLAQVSYARHHAPDLRKALESVRAECSPERVAFLEYQIASLEGDNEGAATYSAEWAKLDPANVFAISAAMVAFGIGAQRWQEAFGYAVDALQISGDSDLTILNNAAYIFAMAGKPAAAIDLLEPYLDQSFVFKATLGLSYLAAGDVSRGMRLYREAAQEAEKRGDREDCSLMTEYQGLVLRQLGILDAGHPVEIAANALPSVPLPDDWQDRPEFLRLKFVADRHGYGWPLAF